MPSDQRTSSRVSVRFYPERDDRRWVGVWEFIKLFPYAVVLFVIVIAATSHLTGWMLGIVLLALLPLHIYMTTDLLVSERKRAECMGYGLVRDMRGIWFTGYSEHERYRHSISKLIASVDAQDGCMKVSLVGGRSVALGHLGSVGRELFATVYEKLRSGASLEDLKKEHSELKSRVFFGLSFREGQPRIRYVEYAAVLLLSVVELEVARIIVRQLYVHF